MECPSRPHRSLNLRIHVAKESVDSETSEFVFLLSELYEGLLEIEEKFVRCGYKEKCVDIKLERSKLKRWAPGRRSRRRWRGEWWGRGGLSLEAPAGHPMPTAPCRAPALLGPCTGPSPSSGPPAAAPPSYPPCLAFLPVTLSPAPLAPQGCLLAPALCSPASPLGTPTLGCAATWGALK